MLRGIDLSSYQGRPDLTKIPKLDRIAFVILKCAEGHSNAQDHDFIVNRGSARAAGLTVGCYNFAHPEPSNDPRIQAALHYQASAGLGSNPGEIPPALDFEEPQPDQWAAKGCSPAQLRDWALEYLDAATSLWGCKPMLYSYPDFLAHVGPSIDFAFYPLWMADYRLRRWPIDGEAPTMPKPWKTWSFWQASGGALYKLPNGADADTNVWNGDAGALAAFCTGTSV